MLNLLKGQSGYCKNNSDDSSISEMRISYMANLIPLAMIIGNQWRK